MSDVSVVSVEQHIFVDPFFAATAVANNGPKGPRGPKGLTGLVGNGTGYVTDAAANAVLSSIDARLDALEAGTTGWITLPMIPTWDHYGGEWGQVRYRRVGTMVFMDGLIRGTVPPSQQQIATIPVGFRPVSRTLFLAHTASPYTPGRVDVNPDGSIVWWGGQTQYISMTGIAYSTV